MAFVNGPATPPEGSGSLAVTLSSSAQKRQFYNYEYGRCATGLTCTATPTSLTAFDELGYSTYRASVGGGNWNLSIEADPDSTANGLPNVDYVSLVFVPSGTVSGTWQTWDALSPSDGVWYATRNLGALGGGLFNCSPFSCSASFSQIQTAFPNAVVALGMGLNVGSGANGFSGSADAVTIGVSGDTTVFDLELGADTSEVVDGGDYNPNGPWFSPEASGVREFVPGPATPPAGAGSLRMSAASSAQKVQFYNYAYGACATGVCGDVPGQMIVNLSTLEYSTLRKAGSTAGTTPTLILEVDPDVSANEGANIDYTSLVFVPTPGMLVDDAWQTWDAFDPAMGTWYSTRNLGAMGGGVFNCSPFSCSRSFAQIVTALPNAMITGGVGFNIGSGWSSFDGAADNLAIGVLGSTATYDLEAPTVSVAPASVSVIEGNSGTQTVNATVTMSGSNLGSVTVPYTTVAGTASTPSDFVAAAGSLVFTPGQTSKTIALKVKGEQRVEPDEDFSLVIGPVSNASIGNASSVVTIQNNDKPNLVVVGAYGSEGGNIAVKVRLRQAAPSPVTVTLQSSSGTAIEGVDFTTIDGTVVNFALGEKGPKTVLIPVAIDGTTEPVETLTVTGSSPDVRVSPITANAYIRSNAT